MVAAGVAAVHHLSFNYLQSLGWNTICFVEPGFGRVLAHAGYVVAETAVLSFIAVWLQRDAVQASELQNMVDHLSSRRDGAIELDVESAGYRSPGALRQAEMVQDAVQAVDTIRDAGAHGQQQAAGAVGQAEEVSRMAGQGSAVMQQSVATMVATTITSQEQGQLIADVGRIVKDISTIAHDNVHTLEAAGQSVQRLELASTELVESVRRFSIDSADRQVIEEDGLARGAAPLLAG